MPLLGHALRKATFRLAKKRKRLGLQRRSGKQVVHGTLRSAGLSPTHAKQKSCTCAIQLAALIIFVDAFCAFILCFFDGFLVKGTYLSPGHGQTGELEAWFFDVNSLDCFSSYPRPFLCGAIVGSSLLPTPPPPTSPQQLTSCCQRGCVGSRPPESVAGSNIILVEHERGLRWQQEEQSRRSARRAWRWLNASLPSVCLL